MGELITRWVKIGLAFAILWAGVFFWNGYGCRKIVGREMEPAVKRDSLPMLALNLTKTSDFQKGDVVYYEYEQAGLNQPAMAGRVIGLPGDRVQITEGDVSVNGARVDQSYVTERSTETLSEIIVPRNCLYILCDNRREYAEYDSRGLGPIGVWAVDGKLRK